MSVAEGCKVIVNGLFEKICPVIRAASSFFSTKYHNIMTQPQGIQCGLGVAFGKFELRILGAGLGCRVDLASRVAPFAIPELHTPNSAKP